MDAGRFDDVVRSLVDRRTRRALLVVGGFLGTSVFAFTEAKKKHKNRRKRKKKHKRNRNGCIGDGKVCKASNPEKCCSGTCVKSGKKARCVGAPDAFGCTNRQNSCIAVIDGLPILCPENQTGACFVTSDHKPFCSNEGIFTNCQSDADCVEEFGNPDAHCIECAAACPGCEVTTACYFPLTSG